MTVVLGDALVRVRPDMSSFGSDLERGVDSSNPDQIGADAGTKMGGGLTSKLGNAAKVGATIIGAAATAGAAAFAKRSVGLEVEFGRTMNQLQAATHTPAKGMKELSDLALKMGADTVFSASDASEAMLELAKGGLSAAQIKAGALQSALTLAAAGGLAMADAASTMGNAMHAFNIPAAKSADVAAALAGAANASSASVESIALGLQQAGTVAADAGFSIQETTGAIAALANAGIAGSDAGTSLKTMFARLVPSTDAAFDAMSSYGLVTYDASVATKALAENGIKPLSLSYGDVYDAVSKYMVQQGVAKEGTVGLAKATEDYLKVSGIMHNDFLKKNGDYKSLGAIAGELQKSFQGLSASERASAMNTIFGSDARRAATVLTNEGTKGLAKYIRATSDKDAADKMAAASMKGTAGAIEQMKGSIETASLAFGMAIKPVTMFAASVVTDIANGAVPIIQDLGGHLRGLLKGVDLGGGIKRALGSVDIGAIFAGIGASVRGIDWSGIGGGFRSIGSSLKGIDWGALRDGLGEGAADTLSVFAVAVGFAADHVDVLAKALPALIVAFAAYKTAQAASNVVAIAQLPLQTAQITSNFVLASSQRALAAQMAVTTGVERVGIVTRMQSTVATAASAVAQRAAAAGAKAWAATQWLLNAALTANPIGVVVVSLAAVAIALYAAWKKSGTFRKITTAAFGAVAGAAMSAFGWVKRNWPLLLAILTGPIGLAVLAINRNWDRIKNGASSVVEFVRGIPKRLGDLAGRFGTAGRDLIGAFVDGMKNAAGIIGGIAGNVWDTLKDLLNGAIDRINSSLDFTIRLPGPDLHINAPNIPHLWTGGRATRPTLAMIGDGREPESVIPDSMLITALERAALAGAGGGARGGGNTYQIYEAHSAAATAREVARMQAFAGGA